MKSRLDEIETNLHDLEFDRPIVADNIKWLCARVRKCEEYIDSLNAFKGIRPDSGTSGSGIVNPLKSIREGQDEKET